MKKTAIHRVLIEFTNGLQIVLAPAYPTLPVQIIKPSVTGRIGEVIEITADDLIGVLQKLHKRAQMNTKGDTQ